MKRKEFNKIVKNEGLLLAENTRNYYVIDEDKRYYLSVSKTQVGVMSSDFNEITSLEQDEIERLLIAAAKFSSTEFKDRAN